ncbi:MAG: nucleotide-binding protein [Proteobacteria bacterium]|nr:nucleotide-binding protein [Pseudomonadota bacterium]
MKNFVVFYSWQSDLPVTRKFIQKALTSAANTVMEELPDVSITIDQATRGLTGSPNIPLAIMKKIKKADMVVSDVTPINADLKQKKTPNPNVLFELGFAVAALGWDRVALVFDAGVGNFPDDVPFDFDKHRAISFPNSVDNHANDLKALVSTLKKAIKSTLEEDPARPTATLTPEEVRHQRDVETLTEIFEKINVQVIDDHFSKMPHCISDAALHVWDMFSIVSAGNDFHLNDAELFELIHQFRAAFGKTLAFEGYYHEAPGGLQHIFTGHDILGTASQQKAWNQIDEARNKMNTAFQEILRRIRMKYLEVDLKMTSKVAWKDYVEYRKSLKEGPAEL